MVSSLTRSLFTQANRQMREQQERGGKTGSEGSGDTGQRKVRTKKITEEKMNRLEIDWRSYIYTSISVSVPSIYVFNATVVTGDVVDLHVTLSSEEAAATWLFLTKVTLADGLALHGHQT